MLSTIKTAKSVKLGAVAVGLSVSACSTADNLHQKWFEVSGQATHYFSSAIKHSTIMTDTGKVDRSTDTIDLTGDINGRVLYHVTSRFDFQAQTLTNHLVAGIFRYHIGFWTCFNPGRCI